MSALTNVQKELQAYRDENYWRSCEYCEKPFEHHWSWLRHMRRYHWDGFGN